MTTEQRLTQVFVELADTLVDEFDALDFLSTLTERSVELLPADAAGVILNDLRGGLHVVASTSDQAQLLELLELQNDEGPCLDCFSTGRPVVNVSPSSARTRWPRFSVAAEKVGFHSAHAIPLRLRSSVIGAMNLFCTGTVETQRRRRHPRAGAGRHCDDRIAPRARRTSVEPARRATADRPQQSDPDRAGQGGAAGHCRCGRGGGVPPDARLQQAQQRAGEDGGRSGDQPRSVGGRTAVGVIITRARLRSD